MSNTFKVASVIAKEAVKILQNNCVMGNKVHRAHESEFKSLVNGYKKGDTITIRKPADFTVTDGATADIQDIVEGSTSLVINKRKHVAFEVTTQDMTLKLSDFRERVIKPAAIQLANQVDVDIMSLYKDVPNWVGSPATPINSFADFAKGPERLDEYAVPQMDRTGVLSPADHWGLLGSQTGLYIQEAARGAYRTASMGMIGGVDTYMSQNVPTHTVGSDVSGTVNGAVTASTISYDDVKDTNQQTITTNSVNLNPGDVFTIADVYAVNPVTKEALSIPKQFTVVSYSSNSLTFSPAMIWSGPQQTIYTAASDLDTKAITAVGSAGSSWRQNMVFNKNAFALAMVPLEKPAAGVGGSRFTEDGYSIRVQPWYDGTNDVDKWRMDILYGVKAIDPRQAVRISGTT